jgi:hypothetical protein
MFMSNTTEIKQGDRVINAHNLKHGKVGEFLDNGDVEVFYDDDTYGITKHRYLKLEANPN